jgi:hypothetical protein
LNILSAHRNGLQKSDCPLESNDALQLSVTGLAALVRSSLAMV